MIDSVFYKCCEITPSLEFIVIRHFVIIAHRNCILKVNYSQLFKEVHSNVCRKL